MGNIVTPTSQMAPPPERVGESGVDAALAQVEHAVVDSYHRFEDAVRDAPAKYVFGAVAVGYCLHQLPLGAIIRGKLRLLSALAPPALLLLGAAKAYEFLNADSNVHANPDSHSGFGELPKPGQGYPAPLSGTLH